MLLCWMFFQRHESSPCDTFSSLTFGWLSLISPGAQGKCSFFHTFAGTPGLLSPTVTLKPAWRPESLPSYLLQLVFLFVCFFASLSAFIMANGGRSEWTFWIRNTDKIPKGLLQWWSLTKRRIINHHLDEISSCNTISRTHTHHCPWAQTGLADILESVGHFVYDN